MRATDGGWYFSYTDVRRRFTCDAAQVTLGLILREGW